MTQEAEKARTIIDVVESPSAADNRVILEGLRAFNAAQIGRDATPIPLSVFVRTDGGVVQGGLIGQMLWDWLYIDKFWLPDALRGSGLGGTVLAAAEERAISRGCRWSHLQTLDFQALPFYERRGYALFGVLEGYPPGSQRFYLRKTLVEPAGSAVPSRVAMNPATGMDAVARASASAGAPPKRSSSLCRVLLRVVGRAPSSPLREA
jgi:GNAT superfamily N-acetyltransferase